MATRQPEPSAADCDPLRVLVVDDEPDIRFAVGLLLQRVGHEVVGQAEDGQHGIELAEKLHPDVIVLDLMMPVLSGDEALPHLVARCPHAMIAVFSASTRAEHRRDVLAGGAFCFYDKAHMDRLPALLAEDYRRFVQIQQGRRV